MSTNADEVLRRAQEALERRRQQQETVTDPEPEPPAEVPALNQTAPQAQPQAPQQDIPFPDLTQYDEAAPALEQATAALSRAQEERGLTPESEKGVWSDTKTTAKIAALYPVAGALQRGEQEMGLRELTKGMVLEQVPDADRAGLDALARSRYDKPLEDLKWRELDRIAINFYRDSDKDWRKRLAEMAGYREGDEPWATEWEEVEWGPDKLRMVPPSGSPAFPMAPELIQGSLESGHGNFYEDFIRPVFSDDTPQLAEEMTEAIRRATEEYSVETRASLEKSMVADDAVWYNPLTYFNEETKDPFHDLSAFLHTAGQQSGNLIGMAVAARFGGRVGASSYTRSRVKPGSSFEEIQGFQRTGALVGGAAAGGKAEMALIRDAVFGEAHSRIERDVPDEVWNEHQPYLDLVDGGMSPTEAKQIIAYQHASNAGDLAMIVSGAMLGTPMGAFYGSLTGRSAGREAAKQSILRQMATGAALETGQEMAQEFSEQIASNLAVMKVDPDQDLFEGGLEAVVTAAFISAPFGAVSGIRSDKGAGIAKQKDALIRKAQPWVNAANERWKFQNKVGPNTKFAKDASPQQQLDAMIELERLQEKEASEFMKMRGQARQLLEDTGASTDELLKFDAKVAGYEKDLSMIAQRKKARLDARKAAAEEKRSQKERAEARAQVERDVNQINENMRMVANMQTIQRNELLENEGAYEELVKAGYGTYTGRGDSNFVLTERGVRAMQEMAKQADDIRTRIESGYSGPERRTQRVLRESFQNLSDEEFESQVMRDHQTNLWNRRKLESDLQESPPAAVAVFDADALKWINDNMSHSAGDEYLRAITREIEDLGRGFNAYRFGGDEFVVTATDEEALQSAVEKALARINALPRIEEAGKSVSVQVSVGTGTDMDSADAALNVEKQRRIEAGERADTRIEGSVPPSLRTTEPKDSPQMALFALAANSNNFNDEAWGDSTYSEQDWDRYVFGSTVTPYRRKLGKVDDTHFSWIEEIVGEITTTDNKNNPPVTVVHDAEWLRKLAPNQYEELMDLPFGAAGVRGMFSMNDPSHGVFLMADVIISEAKSKLKKGDRIMSWQSAKWHIKDGDAIEVIDNDGNIRIGRVKSFSYKPGYQGFYQTGIAATKQTPKEKRLQAEAIKVRQKLNKMAKRELSLLKQHSKMSAAKKKNPNHPLNKQLSRLLDETGALEQDLRDLQDGMQLQRSLRWLEEQQESQKKEADEDQVTVEMDDGSVIKFDPKENLPLDSDQELNLGRFRTPNAKTWRGNLGNEVAAQDEPLTKEMVQRIAADTLMHEMVGHYGIRGITRDFDTYIELTHAIVDAFPELANILQVMGYQPRDDIPHREGVTDLRDANKALLGEEIMAWKAGDLLGPKGWDGLNQAQTSAISRFLTWLKQQLIKLGFNDLYRANRARRIRSLRRQLHKAKTQQKRREIHRKLYGYTNEKGRFVPGEVYVGESTKRQKKWQGGKQVPGGKVVRTQSGFLNDTDLLNIIRRSADFIRKGRRQWNFRDHLGGSHVLPMRDTEFYRKPVHYVLNNAYRPRTEEEKLTKEDEAPLPEVPTTEQAYEQLFGTPPPAGFTVLGPADFKDEAKRQVAELRDRLSKEEFEQMKKDRLLPTPKTLFDESTANMSEELKQQALQVKSVIAQVKKEREKREKGLASKKAKIDLLNKRWGREAVEKDQIPLFPEVGSLNDFASALEEARKLQYVSPMEIEASGFYEKVWPSRMKNYFDNGILDMEPMATWMETERPKSTLTTERLKQLIEPNTRMTPQEADDIVAYMEHKNKNALDLGGGYSLGAVDSHQMNAKTLMHNNGITLSEFVDFTASWVNGSLDKNLATIVALLGENNELANEYRDAMAAEQSSDPDEVAEARAAMVNIMRTPINPVSLQIPRDWVAHRIETPVYEVFAMSPNSHSQSVHYYYEKFTGRDSQADGISFIEDVTDQQLRSRIRRAMKRDELDGPDVGFDPEMQKWVIPQTPEQTERAWYSEGMRLMPMWLVDGSNNAKVFWQIPVNGTRTHHYGWSDFPKHGLDGPQGIWGHARFGETLDADQNPPTAPNPDKQGRAFIPFEFQADAFQDAHKQYASEAEANAASVQLDSDLRTLTEIARNFFNGWNDFLMYQLDKELDAALKRVEGDMIRHVYSNMSGGEEAYNKLTAKQQTSAREIAAMRLMSDEGVGWLNANASVLQLFDDRLQEQLKPLNRMSSNNQPMVGIDEYAQPNYELDISFIGDARVFEMLDKRALQLMIHQLKRLNSQFERSISQIGAFRFREQIFEQIANQGGIRGYMRSPTVSHHFASEAKNTVSRVADHTSNNQPAHRIPAMQAVLRDTMTELFEELSTDLPGRRNPSTYANMLVDQAMDVSHSKVVVNVRDWADLATDAENTYTSSTIGAHLNNWAAEQSIGRATYTSNIRDGEMTITFIGQTAALEELNKNLEESLRRYLSVKFNETTLSDAQHELALKQQLMEREWYEWGGTIDAWRGDFQLQQASVRITEDADNPFENSDTVMAGSLTPAEANDMLRENGAETFELYVKRKWDELWSNMSEDSRTEMVNQGGSETDPTTAMLESYREAWNDSRPLVIKGKIPVEWNQQSTPTDYHDLLIIKKRVDDGDRYRFIVNGTPLVSHDWWTLQHSFPSVIESYYQSQGITANPYKFSALRTEYRNLSKDIKTLQDRIEKGLVAETQKVDTLFDDSVAPITKIGNVKNPDTVFNRMIDGHKKSGWKSTELIQKNDQWKTTEILWSISEAIRMGYARVHLASGSASGRRGGFLDDAYSASHYYTHAPSIQYNLTKKTVRGEERDVLVVKAANVKEPMWIDVTNDGLAVFNPDKPVDESDPFVGFYSTEVALQLGRDVAEKIASKLAVASAKKNRYLITGSNDTGWHLQDQTGLILSTHPSKRSAQDARRVREKAAETGPVDITGHLSESEIGGPIMFLRTKYQGGSPFALNQTGTYVHTVQRPTLYGGRANYDIFFLNKFKAYLKPFGVEIEEGYVKVRSSHMKEAIFAEGGRKRFRLEESFSDAHPNLRVEEVEGENYGWIVTSDNGIVEPYVFPTAAQADGALADIIAQHTVEEDGTIKVYQFTINDELRKVHEKPVNPYMSINTQARDNEQLRSALKKIGSNEPSLVDRFNAWRKTWKAEFNTGMFDRFYGILHALKVTGQSNEAYMKARLSTGLDAVMRGIMEYGHPVWRDGVVQNEGKGLLKILEPVANDIELWAAYMAGKRAKRLKEEGREHLFTDEEIEAMVELGEQYPMFEEVARDYAAWNKKLLDFAEEAGTINPETRPLWENADYIPFYRIVDERLVGPLAKGVGVANQRSPIKTLKGGEDNVGDLIHNIFINATRLMDGALKNNAALAAVDALVPTGMLQKEPMAFGKELIPMSQVGKILKQNGINVDDLPPEVTDGLRVMFAIKQPKGQGVISVMRDGKVEFYRTEDDLLFRSLTALNMEAFGAWMNLLRAPKRVLTTLVTLDPGFMVANFIRDSMSGWVLSRDKFVPMIGGLKGFATAITEGDTMKAMIGSGAAFDSGFINQGDPKSTHRYIKNAMKDAGFQRTLMNTPRKLFEGWKRIGSATENANRIAVYEAAKRAGKSELQALYESKDIMDFSMGGDWPFIQFLIQTVPFMGARMQGLQRLGRGAAEDPRSFAMKGGLLTIAGMALWFAFREDERYKRLEDWDKDTYFHWWIGDTHYRLPKGFEVGAIFNTIPERIFEYMYSNETDAGKFLMRRWGYMLAETFNMNPIPQAVRPMVEGMFNHNFFTGRQIESPWEQERLPEDRYRYYTSPTMIELAAVLPDGLDTVAEGKIKSPLQLQNLYHGYTGTIGRYVLMASDAVMREMLDYPVTPEMQTAQYPVMGRFFRGEDKKGEESIRRTRYEEEFYRELRTVIQVGNSLSFAEKELALDDPRYDEIEEAYGPHLEAQTEFQSFRREISAINRDIKEIYRDPDMSREDKRAEIDQLQKEKNEIFREAYMNRPGAQPEDDDLGSIDTLIDNFDPSSSEPPDELRQAAPDTANLLETVVAMNDKQLGRLARAANYSGEA